MIWRNNSYTGATNYKNRECIFTYALSIVLLLVVVLTTTTSCKEECVDTCMEFSLVLDETDCSCVCPEKQTPFTINGYVYCIEESETHDIYVLENFNLSALVRSDEDCNPPEIFLSRIPKNLDSLESFYLEWYEDFQYSFYFQFYIQEFSNQYCRSASANNRHEQFVPIHWLINHILPEIYIFGAERHFRYGVWDEIRHNLFKNTSGVGVVRFIEDMDYMTFHYLGYKNINHMSDAFYDLAPEEIFTFPYVPREAPEVAYDPLYKQLIFSRLKF